MSTTITTTTEDWFDTVCRYFTSATGCRLAFMPVEPDNDVVVKSQLENDPRCTWYSEVHDGQQVAGYVSFGPNDDQERTAVKPAALSLAEQIVELLNKLTVASRSLEASAREVSTLVDISRTVSDEHDILESLQRLLRAIAELTNFRAASFYLLNPTTSELYLRGTHNHTQDSQLATSRNLCDNPPDLDALVQGWTMLKRGDSAEAYDWLPDEFALGLCIAVKSSSGPLGTLWVYDRRTRVPSEQERHVVESIAAQIAAVLERIVLLQESKHQHRIKRELETITEEVTDDVTVNIPDSAGLDIAGRCLSRHEVGGDLCELIPLDDHRVLIAIGDASGDSIPAAIVMTAVHGALCALASGEIDDVCDTVRTTSRINDMLYRITPAYQFMSFLYGVYDARDRSFTYTNAGHPTPLWLHEGEISELTSHGMLLGVCEGTDYEASTIHFAPNDFLVLFSDGIVEAMNRSRQMFRSDGIIPAIRQNANSDATEVLNAIWSRFEKHSEGGSDPDDRSLLVVRVEGQELRVKS